MSTNVPLSDALRPQIGRLSDLICCIEEECDTTGSVCHGHDLTPDGECALAADLISIFHALQGALFANEDHVTQWGIELGAGMAYGATTNTREAAELAASTVPGAKIREVRNCSWAGVTLYDTTAGGNSLIYATSPCPSCGRTDEPTDLFHVCPSAGGE